MKTNQVLKIFGKGARLLTLSALAFLGVYALPSCQEKKDTDFQEQAQTFTNTPEEQAEIDKISYFNRNYSHINIEDSTSNINEKLTQIY
jgi:hypothetical protein